MPEEIGYNTLNGSASLSALQDAGANSALPTAQKQEFADLVNRIGNSNRQDGTVDDTEATLTFWAALAQDVENGTTNPDHSLARTFNQNYIQMANTPQSDPFSASQGSDSTASNSLSTMFLNNSA